jgi:tRNA nucleotidyltransferase (CCA-adding enzyme)
VLRLLERCDALRKPERFEQILLACECDARGRLGREEQPYPQRERLRQAARLALAVSTAEIATQAQQQGLSGPQIGQAVRRARTQALQALGG